MRGSNSHKSKKALNLVLCPPTYPNYLTNLQTSILTSLNPNHLSVSDTFPSQQRKPNPSSASRGERPGQPSRAASHSGISKTRKIETIIRAKKKNPPSQSRLIPAVSFTKAEKAKEQKDRDKKKSTKPKERFSPSLLPPH